MPAVNNNDGYETLKMMKKLTEYMDPEYLTSDSTYVQQQFQQGKIALANLWASRAGAMDNAEESTVVGLVQFASAPKAKKNGKPASTLWWDGVVIAKNVTDEEAEAAFNVSSYDDLTLIDGSIYSAMTNEEAWRVYSKMRETMLSGNVVFISKTSTSKQLTGKSQDFSDMFYYGSEELITKRYQI